MRLCHRKIKLDTTTHVQFPMDRALPRLQADSIAMLTS